MAGSGTILLTTDGTTNYTMESFETAASQIEPLLHTYPIDGASNGLTTDFPPTVIPAANPVAPLAGNRSSCRRRSTTASRRWPRRRCSTASTARHSRR